MKKRLLALIMSIVALSSAPSAYAAEAQTMGKETDVSNADSFLFTQEQESTKTDETAADETSVGESAVGEAAGAENVSGEGETQEPTANDTVWENTQGNFMQEEIIGSDYQEEYVEEPEDYIYEEDDYSSEDSEEELEFENALGGFYEELEDEETWLNDHNMTKNAEGMYENVDENGEVRAFDPQDPEFAKYFVSDDSDLIGLWENAEDLESSLFSVDEDKPDPYLCTLTGFKYSYPSYYKKSDASKRPIVRNGMDISYYQGNISKGNFRIMKETYGVDFVILRAGYRGYGSSGSMNVDKCFSNNVKNAAQAGLKVGVYYFSQAISEEEGREEAEHCMEIIGDNRDLITLPVIIDYEYAGNPGRLQAAGLSDQEHTDVVNAFCERVAEEGFVPGVYANKSMFEKDMNFSGIEDDNYIWMANFVGESGGVYSTSFSGRLNVWQFTSSFSGFGEKGLKLMTSDRLDLNFWYGAFPGETFVSFDANGGSGQMDIIREDFGKEIRLPECEFEREGATFREWNTDPDGSGTGYAEGSFFEMTQESVKLYAIWEYNVTFETNGGSDMPQVKAVADALLKAPPEPTRENYFFGGWYKDKDLTEAWDFAADRVNRDTVLYASWDIDDENSWGDLDKPENADAKAFIMETYETPDSVPESFWIYGTEDKYYTGKAVIQDNLKVFYKKTQLLEDADYSIKYTNNVKAGSARILVTGKGNYRGSYSENFNILKASLEGRTTAKDISLFYNGKVQKGTTTVTYRDEDGREVVLKNGTDFGFFYPNTNKKSEDYDSTAFVGSKDEDCSYHVMIVGKGNYEGVVSFTETILRKDGEFIPVSKLSVGAIRAQSLSHDEYGDIMPAEPKPLVRYGKEVLTESTDEAEGDYTLEYINNTSAGTGSVYIIGQGKYVGSRCINFKVNAVPMSKVKVYQEGTGSAFVCDSSKVFTSDDITQEGYELRIGASGSSEGEVLVEGRDYEVSYSGNVNVGNNKAAIIFTGKGIYRGVIKKPFSIKAAPIIIDGGLNPDISMYMNKSIPYVKAGAKPGIDIIYREGTEDYHLKEGRDYTVKLSNNKKVNDGSDGKKLPTATITGKGNFSGKLSVNYTIYQADISNLQKSATDIVYANKANICKPKIVLTEAGGNTLKAGTDYEKTVKYSYVDKTTGVTVDIDMTTIVPENTEVTATVTGCGNYTGEATIPFRFVHADIAKATVKISPQPYTGKPVLLDKDSFTMVKLGGKELTTNDFEIVPGTYKKNTSVGTAKVTIRGCGDYGGTKVVSFKIVK